MRPRVLVVDDDRPMCEMIQEGLPKLATTLCGSADEALTELLTGEFDAVVTDVNMRGMSGLELCRRVVESRPDLPVIVVTAFGSFDSAIAAIRAGAYDYITKPFELEALAHTVNRAVQHRLLREEVKRLRVEVQRVGGGREIIGTSAPMRKVYDLLDRVAGSDASVLITGESGTGKEVVARALHDRGKRHRGPFVAINCAAMPEALLESELFGHTRGAFTDAKEARAGLFSQANGGTIFLDEIGDMPLALQPKLLRALQDRKVRSVGGTAEVAFDARVIAATNRDLESAVEEQRFREDLFYRINVIQIDLPPLRVRGNDVLLLAQHFIGLFAAQASKKVVGLSPAAAEKLLAYAWPGNVRELSNCIERSVALTRYEELTVEDLAEKVRHHRRINAPLVSDDPSEIVPLEEIERRYILRVLEGAGGNKSLAAQLLGLDRKTLYRKLDRYAAGDSKRDREGG